MDFDNTLYPYNWYKIIFIYYSILLTTFQLVWRAEFWMTVLVLSVDTRGCPWGPSWWGGSLTSSEAGLWREGDRVSYECAPGWRHQGPGPGRSTRECRGAARWSHHTLHCGESGPAHWTHWMRAIFNFRGESFAQPAQSSVRNIP